MEDEREPASLDAWLRSWVSDPTLRPVLIVAVGIVSTLGAALLVLVFGDRNPFAMAALAIVIVVSAQGGFRLWKSGRRGLLGVLVGIWSLSGLGAVAAILWLPA